MLTETNHTTERKAPIETDVITFVDPAELQTRPPFSDLFPIAPATLEAIEASMRAKGFDVSKPLNVWISGNVVVDGHTRRQAAIAAVMRRVPVVYHAFADEEEALYYAIANQRDRRNLTEDQILTCVEAVDKLKQRGRHQGNQYTGVKAELEMGANAPISTDAGRSAEKTAQVLGVSQDKVKAARTVLTAAKEDPTIRENIRQGKASIRGTADKIRQKKKKKKLGVADPIRAPKSDILLPVRTYSSALNKTDEDEKWLAQFSLRTRAIASYFDEDALIYREFAPILAKIQAQLLQLIGERSDSGRSLLYRAIMRITVLPSIKTWSICSVCQGKGFDCRKCKGGGYTIPGL